MAGREHDAHPKYLASPITDFDHSLKKKKKRSKYSKKDHYKILIECDTQRSLFELT